MKNKIIDITPPAKLFEFFKKLSYSLTSAVSELIDNSIASFNEDPLFFEGKSKEINIIFDASRKRIIIRDTAKGIQDHKWKRVLRIMETDIGDNSGYNEFGMGLKTSGFWLGDKIRIITKSAEEQDGRMAVMDLKKIEFNPNIEVKVSKEIFKPIYEVNEHGTVIIIDDIDRPLQAQTLNPFVEFFASKYRNDINKAKIQIRMLLAQKNGKYIDLVKMYKSKDKDKSYINNLSYHSTEKLEYVGPKVYKGEIEQIEFTINHRGKNYDIYGWIANRDEGSYVKNKGFSLSRRGNVIVQSYKPKDIFGAGNSWESLRLFGEFELPSNISISQAKDKFDWDDGLESEIIKGILENKGFQKIQALTSVPRVSKHSVKDFTKKDKKDQVTELNNLKQNKNIKRAVAIEKAPLLKEYSKEDNDIWIEIETDSGIYSMCSRILETGNGDSWIAFKKLEDRKFIVTMDMNHAFFNPFNSDKKFIAIMRKFSLIMAIAAHEGEEEYLTPVDLLEKIGEYLAVKLG